MQFTQPLFLIGYAAILIPILIHLFNFRRYKTYYFSNVKMLQDVAQKTKRESRVKHLIVLLLRCLAIIALVTAFARPYFPNHNAEQKSGNLVTIYVDNSFSMEGNTPEGTLFYDGIENARQIVSHFDYADQFILYNNDFTSRQRMKLTKEEALQELNNWNISPNSRTWKELLPFEKSACTESADKNVFHYYISDFQKNNFNFNEFSTAAGNASYLIHKPAKSVSNVSIDSCWFLSPVFRAGQQVTLTVRLRNCGEGEVIKLPMKLHVNGEQKAMAAVDIAAGGTAEYQLNYTLSDDAVQCGTLSIEDAPITFDNTLYFIYRVSDNSRITVVDEKEQNRYVNALYGKDSVFEYSAMPASRINYSAFSGSAVVVLDEVKSISSGLADELSKYLNSGGTVLVLPAEEMDAASWNSFLSGVGASQYGSLVQQELKVGNINYESIYFKGSLDQSDERIDMPTSTQHFTFSDFHTDETVMSLENQAPLLTVNKVGNGRIILSAVAMNDRFGNIHKHALFFIPLHNIGIRTLMQQKLYNTIGRDHSQSVAKRAEGSENVLSLKSQKGGQEIIPEQKNLGGETMLFFNDQLSEAGLYDVLHDGAKQDAVAFNYDRKESQLTYHTDKELRDAVSAQPKESHVQLITGDSQDISGQIVETIHGKPLWFYFILIALGCLLAEVAILRLWKHREKTQV
jgi:hypothetical protein